MPDKLLADENIPAKAIDALRGAGCDVLSIRERAPGIADEEVLRIAVAQDRVLVTFDRDYGELVFGQNLVAPIGLLDVVALTEDVPGMRLLRGQVGTVVDILAPEACEVEFCDDEGRSYASTALSASQLLVLRYRPQVAE